MTPEQLKTARSIPGCNKMYYKYSYYGMEEKVYHNIAYLYLANCDACLNLLLDYVQQQANAEIDTLYTILKANQCFK